MTANEKLDMYRGKKAFIENLSKAFEAGPAGSTVTSIDYEVYSLELKDDITYYKEYIIVTFKGGSISVRSANGNSNTANFRAIGTLLDGGYYDEVFYYENLEADGYKKVEL